MLRIPICSLKANKFEQSWIHSWLNLSIVTCNYVFKSTNILFWLRLYGTPCNIFKDDRIIKHDYNHGFKIFIIYNICPQNAFIKFHREIKSKTGASFERATHRLLAYLQPTELRGNLPNKVQIIPINKK